jgi:hypothetical protein
MDVYGNDIINGAEIPIVIYGQWKGFDSFFK